MPSPGFRLKGTIRSCHACRLRKVRCIYPDRQEQNCERCRDGGVQCIPAAQTPRKSNWRRSVDEVIAQQRAATADDNQTVPATATSSPHDLPNYIKPLPAYLSTSAVTYLQEGQAFTIPNDEVRDIILESYFEFYHPSTPLIDPWEFAESITQNAGQLSLLLLQAMLFIGSTYIDAPVLRELGLSTNKEARRVFFERATLLHEFDCEEDQYISAQALVLLSNWYEPTDRKDSSYWLAHAISAMQTLPKATFSASRANRRLWWSIYLRDRSVNWSARRSLSLHAEDCTVQELILKDFYMNSSISTGSRFIRNPLDQEDNAYACMEFIKLHTTISNLILLRPVLQGHRSTAKFAGDLTKNPRALFTKHLEWALRLPENLQYHSPTGVARSRCLSVQLSLLHLLYWTSIVETCEYLPANATLPPYISENATSPAALSNHALQVVQSIFRDLKGSNYISYIPLAGVVALPRCIALIIRQLEALPSLDSFTLSRPLVELMDALQSFRTTYTIAEHIFKVFCLGLKQIILRDLTQVLFLDQTDLDAWNIKNPDSAEEIDRLYKNIRLLLLRLDTKDATPSLPVNSFYAAPPSSTSNQTFDPAQAKLYTTSEDLTTIVVPTAEAMNTDSLLSSFQEQMPYTSEFLMHENMGGSLDNLDGRIDMRDLMSIQQFEEFCAQFGFDEEYGMRFA